MLRGSWSRTSGELPHQQTAAPSTTHPSRVISSLTHVHRKVKVKVHTLDIASLRSESPPQKRSGMAHVLRQFQFYLHTLHFIHKRNEPYLPLPSQPQLVLIYRPQRDGRLSRPWCEVALAKIRTCNLPTANPALYDTATNAPTGEGTKREMGQGGGREVRGRCGLGPPNASYVTDLVASRHRLDV